VETFYRVGIWFILLTGLPWNLAIAQRDTIDRQPAIYFPQAPLPGEWRLSLGAVFTSTPPELTEEIRLTLPAVDFNIQKGISRQFFLNGRVQTQFLQSNVALGARWAKPINNRWFVSVGDDFAGWLGTLQIKDVFDSEAYGLQNFPNASLGYRLTRELQISAKAEAILDVYYRSSAGGLSVVTPGWRGNGFAFTFMLEQPFYKQQHVSIGLRAAYSRFNWQFWSLYSTFDRSLFYPQLIFNFIL
jgi:hypothetical protein